MAAFSSVTINLKRMSMQGNMRSWEKLFSSGLCLQDRKIAASGLILQERASDLAKKPSIDDFKGSNGWIERWKVQNNVTFKTVSGEANHAHHR